MGNGKGHRRHGSRIVAGGGSKQQGVAWHSTAGRGWWRRGGGQWSLMGWMGVRPLTRKRACFQDCQDKTAQKRHDLVRESEPSTEQRGGPAADPAGGQCKPGAASQAAAGRARREGPQGLGMSRWGSGERTGSRARSRSREHRCGTWGSEAPLGPWRRCLFGPCCG